MRLPRAQQQMSDPHQAVRFYLGLLAALCQRAKCKSCWSRLHDDGSGERIVTVLPGLSSVLHLHSSVISGRHALWSYQRQRKVNHLSSVDGIVTLCSILLIKALRDCEILRGAVGEMLPAYSQLYIVSGLFCVRTSDIRRRGKGRFQMQVALEEEFTKSVTLPLDCFDGEENLKIWRFFGEFWSLWKCLFSFFVSFINSEEI